MCISKPKTPKTEPTPDPAPAPEESATAPVTENDKAPSTQDQTTKSKRVGTKALRVDLGVAQPSGNGLNIPV